MMSFYFGMVVGMFICWLVVILVGCGPKFSHGGPARNISPEQVEASKSAQHDVYLCWKITDKGRHDNALISSVLPGDHPHTSRLAWALGEYRDCELFASSYKLMPIYKSLYDRSN